MQLQICKSAFAPRCEKKPGPAGPGSLVPVVGLDLRCGAGHLGLKHATGMFPSALGFESLIRKKPAPLREAGSLVPVVGLEPTRGRPRRILNPLRLPFHHTGKQKQKHYNL